MFDSLFVYLSHAHADTSCLIKLTEPNEMSALCYYWDCSFLTPDIVAKFHFFVHIWCVKVFDSINLNDFEWHNCFLTPILLIFGPLAYALIFSKQIKRGILANTVAADDKQNFKFGHGRFRSHGL